MFPCKVIAHASVSSVELCSGAEVVEGGGVEWPVVNGSQWVMDDKMAR